MFKVGDEVSYGLHGKCIITGIETKNMSSGSVSFYQIRTLKNPILHKHLNHDGIEKLKASKNEPSILVPTAAAASNGLRALMSKDEAENVLKILSDPDYHFELNLPWVSKQKLLEDTIRREGAVGLAKVVGHLHVMISRDAVPPSVVVRFFESVNKILSREVADCLEISLKEIEPILAKALRAKLAAEN